MDFVISLEIKMVVTLIGFSLFAIGLMISPSTFYNINVIATTDEDSNTQMASIDPSIDPSQNGESNKAVMAVPPNGQCPEGWTPATPPLNPQLQCIPTTMSTEQKPDPSQNGESNKAVMAVPQEANRSQGMTSATPKL